METAEKKKSKHMGRNITYARITKRGISQHELSDEMNVSQSEVSRVERSVELDEAIINKYAKALDVSPAFIRENDLDDYMGTYNVSNNIEANEVSHNPTEHANDNSSQLTGNSNAEQTNYYTDHEAWKEVIKAKEEAISIKDEIIARQDKRIEQIEAELKELRDILLKR